MTAALGRAPLGPPARWQRNAVFGTIATAIVLGWVGDGLWGSIVDRHPLVLIALNAKPRYLILTVNDLDPWSYYPFATARLVVTKPLVWLVGAWYGERAVRWAERRSARTEPVLRWVEARFSRFGWLVVLVTSNNVVCLLAGATGFPLGWFLLLAVAGTVARLWLIDLLGARYQEPIDDVIAFVADHRAAVVIVSLVLLAALLVWQRRSGTGELGELASLEQAVEDDAAP